MGTLCQKCKNKLGVTTLVSGISCVVAHAKLPNLDTVAVLGFILLLEKNERLSTTGRKMLW